MIENSIPYLETIDRTKRILEIGPLSNPMVVKNEDTPHVYYADIRSTEGVKGLYKGDFTVTKRQIADIDFIIETSYAETFRDVEAFDYVLMRHVIEHVPELILFFLDVSTVLKEGGKLCLTIPDARYTFDHYRMPTSFAELYDIYRRGVKTSPARVLDYALSVDMSSNPEKCSDIATDRYHVPNGHGTALEAISAYDAASGGEIFDAHYSVFSPATFLLNIYYLTEAGLFPYELSDFHVPDGYTLEFHAVLTKRDGIQDDPSAQAPLLLQIKQYLSMIAEDPSAAFDPQRYNVLIDEISLMANSFSWKCTKGLRALANRTGWRRRK
jgi:SAM-dependent methyltransferase